MILCEKFIRLVMILYCRLIPRFLNNNAIRLLAVQTMRLIATNDSR